MGAPRHPSLYQLDRGDHPVRFDDLLRKDRFDRDPGERDARGLYLDVPAWGDHTFDVTADTR